MFISSVPVNVNVQFIAKFYMFTLPSFSLLNVFRKKKKINRCKQNCDNAYFFYNKISSFCQKRDLKANK